MIVDRLHTNTHNIEHFDRFVCFILFVLSSYFPHGVTSYLCETTYGRMDALYDRVPDLVEGSLHTNFGSCLFLLASYRAHMLSVTDAQTHAQT